MALDSSGNIYIAEGSVVLKMGAQVTPPANPPSFTESGVVNGAGLFAPTYRNAVSEETQSLLNKVRFPPDPGS